MLNLTVCILPEVMAKAEDEVWPAMFRDLFLRFSSGSLPTLGVTEQTDSPNTAEECASLVMAHLVCSIAASLPPIAVKQLYCMMLILL